MTRYPGTLQPRLTDSSDTLETGKAVLDLLAKINDSYSSIQLQISSLQTQISNLTNQVNNTASVDVIAASPTGTTSATPVMMGLAALITPTSSGRVLVLFSGHESVSMANKVLTTTIQWGTGTAPANGAALTGTQAGGTSVLTLQTASSDVTVAIEAIIPSLQAGVTYWFDVTLATTGGTATIDSANLVVLEV